MFDGTNWVACLNKEDDTRGSPLPETLSVASQGALEISSVIGHPHSLVRDHKSSPRMVAKPCQCSERLRCVKTNLPKVVHLSCRPVCHFSEPETPAVCISSPRPTCLGHRCSEYQLEKMVRRDAFT